MRTPHRRTCNTFTRSLCLGLLLFNVLSLATSRADGVAGMAVVPPESVGFSSARLQRLNAALQRFVDEKHVAGMVTVASRDGKVFHVGTYGVKNLESGAPMTFDTLFRIYSMTKPVTGVAMMILYEEGKWNPRHPIAKYIPELADLKVFKGVDADGNMILEAPEHAPTMHELMTHTAGFSYGLSDGPVDRLYKSANGDHRILGAPSLQTMIDRLESIPLLHQPGARWHYSISVDIQGYLIEKLSGKPLPVFMKERIFEPLGMSDTDFHAPEQKWDRLAGLYKPGERGALAAVEPNVSGMDTTFMKLPAAAMGGYGLVSTAGDYLKFAQMLLNGGELNGVRILAPKTVKMMSADHLPQGLIPAYSRGEGPRPGVGFGYDVAVYTDPDLADAVAGRGTYYWMGAAGTWFWIDPAERIVFVGMVQRFGTWPDGWSLRDITEQTLYQALLDSGE